jgi:dihydroorotase
MAEQFDLILRGGTVVNQDGEGRRDVAVRGNRIVGIGAFASASAAEVIDCRGLHILPGVIDTQVHFREPGMTHKEDLETGSRSAVLGGVTAVFEMPNTDPTTTSGEAFADKIKRAHHRMHCDFAFYIGGTRDNVRDLAELEQFPGCAGVKVFMGSSTGSLLVEDDGGVREILMAIRRRAAFHSEDEFRLRERRGERRPGDPRSHPVWRDELTAITCTERLVRIARETGNRIHVLHVTTAQEIALLAGHKDIASVEVTPHHLTLAAPDCYEYLGTLAQMNPPVRDHSHRAALWNGLVSGVVDVLGSDHAPHTREEKEKLYPNSPSGMTGVQTLVPLMLDHVQAGRLTLARFVDLTSAGPARLFGIASKGRIAVGYDADFTVVDLKRQFMITNEWIASRAGWTPYDQVEVTGFPVGTLIRGRKVMWEGELVSPSEGEPLRFMEALPRSVTAAVRKAAAKPSPRTAAEVSPEAVAEASPQAVAEPSPQAVAGPSPQAVAEASPQAVAEPLPPAVAETSPQAVAAASPEAVVEPSPRAAAEALRKALSKTSPQAVTEASPRTFAEASPETAIEASRKAFAEELRKAAVGAPPKAAAEASPKTVAEAPLKTVAEASPEAAIEASRRALAEELRKAAAGVPPKAAAEASPKTVAEAPLKAVAEASPEAAIEASRKALAEELRKVTAGAPPKAAAEALPKTVAEAPLKAVAEVSPEAVMEASRKALAEELRKATAGAPPKAAAEALPKTVAEAPPKAVADASPEAALEASRRAFAEALQKAAAGASPKAVAEASPRAVAEASPEAAIDASRKAMAEALRKAVAEATPKVVTEASPKAAPTKDADQS